jgi:hypothetical protein
LKRSLTNKSVSPDFSKNGKRVLFGISFENSVGTSFDNYVKRSIVLNVSTIGYSSVSVSEMLTEPERNHLSDSVGIGVW